MKILIIGAGGHGRVVLDIINSTGLYEAAGFIDEDQALHGSAIHGIPILGGLQLLPEMYVQGIWGAIVAVGDGRVREVIARRVVEAGLNLVNVFHASAIISRTCRMGLNNVVAAGAIIGPDVQIGDNVIVNTGAIIEHENVLGNNVHISPGVKLAGRVVVGDNVHVGIGTTVIQNVTIHADAIVGAGSVVLHDVPAGTTIAGVPARTIRSR